MRAHGIVVHDTPQFDSTSPHSIVHPEVTIPLELSGVVSCFETRLPRPDKIDALPHIQFTADTNWEQFSSTLHDYEIHRPALISSLASARVSPGPVHPSNVLYPLSVFQHCITLIPTTYALPPSPTRTVLLKSPLFRHRIVSLFLLRSLFRNDGESHYKPPKLPLTYQPRLPSGTSLHHPNGRYARKPLGWNFLP
jgi:hypothetical protein